MCGLGCELCLDEVFAPVGGDEYFCVTQAGEGDRAACRVLDGVVAGAFAFDVYCFVAVCDGVHGFPFVVVAYVISVWH